jgi:hypothetical protein
MQLQVHEGLYEEYTGVSGLNKTERERELVYYSYSYSTDRQRDLLDYSDMHECGEDVDDAAPHNGAREGS